MSKNYTYYNCPALRELLPSEIVFDVIRIIDKYLNHKYFENAQEYLNEVFKGIGKRYLTSINIQEQLVQKYIEIFGYSFVKYVQRYKEEGKAIEYSEKFQQDMKDLFFLYDVSDDDTLYIEYSRYRQHMEWLSFSSSTCDDMFNFFIWCSLDDEIPKRNDLFELLVAQ
jgi:hypothetical protein